MARTALPDSVRMPFFFFPLLCPLPLALQALGFRKRVSHERNRLDPCSTSVDGADISEPRPASQEGPGSILNARAHVFGPSPDR